MKKFCKYLMIVAIIFCIFVPFQAQPESLEEQQQEQQQENANAPTGSTFHFQLLDDEDVYIITGYSGNRTTIILPQTYNGIPVVGIGSKAFERNNNLTSITIPNCYTSIGHYAFMDCSALTSIVIPKSVTTMGFGVFTRCSALTTIYCEVGSQPESWDVNWKTDCKAKIVWGYKG